MVSRAIYQEIRAGRGIDGKDYVYLDVRHLGRKVIEEKLPDITEFARVYQGVEPITEPVPDPADRPLRDGRHPDRHPDPGDPRRGEHRRARAVRGGGDGLRVGPRREPAGHQLARRPARVRPAGRSPDGRGRRPASTMPDIAADAAEPVRAEIEGLRASTGRESVPRIREQLADVMMDNVGVYRDEALLMAARTRVARAPGALRPRRHRTTRARSSTPTCSRRASSATCSTAPRRPSPPPWPARRAAAPTPARTTPSATTPTSSAHARHAGRRRPRR